MDRVRQRAIYSRTVKRKLSRNGADYTTQIPENLLHSRALRNRSADACYLSMALPA